jgi:hypothetical protein
VTRSSRRTADQFLKVSKALKAAGEKGLRQELHKGVKKAARPLVFQAKAAAREQLPKRGGLNRAVAGSPIRTVVSTGRNKYGVRIVVAGVRGRAARSTNRGKIRHPVFGNRDVWRDQKVPKGWFDDTMRAAAPAIRKDVEAALARVVQDIARKGRS